MVPKSSGSNELGFRAMYPALHRFASVVADRDVDPDDLVQDALVGLLRSPPARIRDPEAYLRRSIVNAMAGVRRRAAVRRVTPVDPATALDELPAGGVQEVVWPAEVRAVMDAVPPADRALLYLLDVEDLTSGTVGSILGMSAVAVRARASRARRAARRVLGGEEDAR